MHRVYTYLYAYIICLWLFVRACGSTHTLFGVLVTFCCKIDAEIWTCNLLFNTQSAAISAPNPFSVWNSWFDLWFMLIVSPDDRGRFLQYGPPLPVDEHLRGPVTKCGWQQTDQTFYSGQDCNGEATFLACLRQLETWCFVLSVNSGQINLKAFVQFVHFVPLATFHSVRSFVSENPWKV